MSLYWLDAFGFFTMILFLLILTIGFFYELEQRCIGMGMMQMKLGGGTFALVLKKTFHQHLQVVVVSEISQGVVLVIRDVKIFYNILYILKKSMLFNFNCLLDVWALDYPTRAKRFELNYKLVNINRPVNLFIKLSVGLNIIMNSIVNLYPSADWLERETWGYVWHLF